MGRLRTEDAEAALNLPPGFRFHPTDDELVLHYLCRKAVCQTLPVPIIAEIDLYKVDPWQLPDMALFGEREWYFFTPRDRKYPNGSRPNRAAGTGYWKATGADKPISPRGTGLSHPLGIKKALVFYAGKAPRGVKTNWIMHEYRLAQPKRSEHNRSLRLDDWVLCRIYNKKNRREMVIERQKQQQQQPMDHESPVMDGGESFNASHDNGSETSRESEIDNDEQLGMEVSGRNSDVRVSDGREGDAGKALDSLKAGVQRDDKDWFGDLHLDDLNGFATSLDTTTQFPSSIYQDYYASWIFSPASKHNQVNPMPF